MRLFYSLKIVVVFFALYVATTSIRHPNFNSFWFVMPLGILVFLFGFFTFNRKSNIRMMALCVFYGIIASSASYLFDWASQGNKGISRYLTDFGANDFFFSLLVMPMFCYAALLLPLTILILNQGYPWIKRITKSYSNKGRKA